MSCAEPTINGGLIAAWLRQAWPRDTAKHAAVVTGAPVRTARGWLSGQVPSPDYLAKLLDHFGLRFAAAVMPGIRWIAEAEMQRQLDEAESRLADLRAQREALEA